MAQRVFLDPKKYAVGADIPEEQYQEAILKIADWFTESRKTKEPAALAKQLFQECLDGVTKDNKPWFAAATATLTARVRSKCRFDLEKMEPLRNASEKNRSKKDKDKARALAKRKTAQEDALIPDELRKDLRRSASYGDNPNIMLSSAEAGRWNELHQSYVTQFPELDAVNAAAELELLCDLHILSERYRMKVLQGQAVDPRTQTEVLGRLQDIKKALGIHPDQLAKRASSKADVSIGAAAARLEAMENWRQIRLRYWVEELLQIYQMFMTPNADGTGYQLDEVGLFGLTRTKPSDCPKCGHRHVAGLSIEEIEKFLIDRGALKPVETV